MSLDIFKQNMLTYMQNQKAIGSYGDFAKKLTQEYDAAVKRGFQNINNIKVQEGNTELMESTLNSVLSTALQQSSGEHPIITNLGTAFVNYWIGAQLNLSPPPIVPAVGALVNVTQTSNFITNPGIWQPTDTLVLEEPTEPPLKSVAELLKEIPDDNNTPDGAEEIVMDTDVEVLSDAGEDAGAQIRNVQTILKKRLILPNPPASKNPKKLKEYKTNTYDGQAIECIGNVKGLEAIYETNLSPNYKVRSLSLDAYFRHTIKAQRGLSFEDIVCNLKGLAVNILEPLRAKYPKIRINSAFRGKPSIAGKVSQHEKGEAVDIQIPGLPPKGYVPIAEWCIEHLPFDQLIFEHGNSIWLHISYKRGGNQRKELLTMFKGKYESGLTLYYD